MTRPLKVYFGYKHIDDAWGGANSFIRALHQVISRDGRVKIVSEIGECDVLFLNGLSKGPACNSQSFTISELKWLLHNNRNMKLVVRAVNLRQHSNPGHFIRRLMNRDFFRDLEVLRLLRFSSSVIFQSAYQKIVFQNAGYNGENYNIIHNGADPDFWTFPKRPALKKEDDLVFLSSSFSAKHLKRLDIVAAMSMQDKVKVMHVGRWDDDVDKGQVILKGVLSHEEIHSLMSNVHYILHPAYKDICPNSIVEGLCAGVPVIYNPDVGSGSELVGNSGIALNQEDVFGTVVSARERYNECLNTAESKKTEFDINFIAEKYLQVFLRVAQTQ